jgi:hypothetical protein
LGVPSPSAPEDGPDARQQHLISALAQKGRIGIVLANSRASGGGVEEEEPPPSSRTGGLVLFTAVAAVPPCAFIVRLASDLHQALVFIIIIGNGTFVFVVFAIAASPRPATALATSSNLFVRRVEGRRLQPPKGAYSSSSTGSISSIGDGRHSLTNLDKCSDGV